MSEKFQNKYRIASARLQKWDYAWAGAYFITICTHNRVHYFGEIENGKMILSNVGVLADVFWYELKNRTPNIELGEFIVMPNHIHGILILNNSQNTVETLHATSLTDTTSENDTETLRTTSENDTETLRTTSENDTETLRATSENDTETLRATSLQMSKISPKPNSISTIIRSYKSAVTKHANRLGLDFGWQSRFYDHIIRDEKSFENISNYIINNPLNWSKDKFH